MTSMKILCGLACAAALTACNDNQSAEAATPTAQTAQAAQAAQAAHEHTAAGTCGECDTTTALSDPQSTTRQSPDGKTITHVGRAFTTAQRVTVADLLAQPDRFAGKVVSVAGNVSAMCKHKRAWFALVGDDSGNHVRIFTAPVFLVPHGSIGKSAIAEGRVEVIEVPVERARHMAAEHKLGDPAAITAPQKSVVLRALGADFS